MSPSVSLTCISPTMKCCIQPGSLHLGTVDFGKKKGQETELYIKEKQFASRFLIFPETCFEVAEGWEITPFDHGDSVTQRGLRSDLNAKYSTALAWVPGGSAGRPKDRPCPEQRLGEWSIQILSSLVSGDSEKRTLREQNTAVLS